MKNKTVLNIGTWIAGLSMIMLIITMIVFLFIEGWHWEVTHPVEKLINAIIDLFMRIALVIYLLAISTHVVRQIEKES